ncbi:MAG: 3-dehydroquinate synthase family protein [Acidimicrobiales bacterium]
MRIAVELGARSYEVVLGAGARHELAALVHERAPQARVAAIVTSGTLRRQPWFSLDAGIEQHVVEVPEGESAKSLRALGELCERLADLSLSRRDVIVGVGGGAVTDLAGFAAAVYLRGISLVQVPTSVAGQVDAAIGGKTAVNLRAGKNLVGAFHQPLGVLCDFDTLATLPERERRSGLGEVAKCWLLEGRRASDLDAGAMAELIALSVRLKAAIVSGDETEGGDRALLNYGHTLGHALEAVALERAEDELRHGEAVAVGLCFAARLARRLGRVGDDEVANHDGVVAALGLSRRLPPYAATEDLIAIMARDKKAHHDLTFVLAGAPGFDVVRGVEAGVVAETLDRFRGEP